MNISRFIPMVVLQLSVSIALADSPEDFPLSFPFFQSSQSTGISDELMVGYGDWCVASEGLHPGLDFGAISGDSVLVPADSPVAETFLFKISELSPGLYFIQADLKDIPAYRIVIINQGD